MESIVSLHNEKWKPGQSFTYTLTVNNAGLINVSAPVSFPNAANLTLHGETKEVTIPATVRLTNNGLSVHGNFTIDRTQFGMNYGRGKVHDDVKIKVAIGK